MCMIYIFLFDRTSPALMVSSRTGSLSLAKPRIRGGNGTSINGIKLPYKVGKKAKKKYAIYNLVAFHH